MRSGEAFDRVLVRVEGAKRELMEAVPSPRGVPGRSLAEALMRFEDSLHAAEVEMEGWRESGRGRDVCAAALGEALRRAARLRLEAPALDYEGLVGVLGDLIAPLDAFEEADALRRSP